MASFYRFSEASEKDLNTLIQNVILEKTKMARKYGIKKI